MTFLFIIPSLLSSIFVLGVTTTTTTAAQPQPQQVRFGRSMRTRSTTSSPPSPSLQRIRDVNVMSPKETLRIDDWSDPSTLRHRRKLTSKPPMFLDMLVSEMLSYPISISMSLSSSFEFDFDNIIISDPNTASTSPPPSSPDITTIPPTSSDHTEESQYVKIMFEYLSQCAGLEVDSDTCLVSLTIDQLMSFEPNVKTGRQRLLQSSNDCGPPPITKETMRSIMNVAIAKDQCHASISDDEFSAVLDTFMGVFAATECWESLCSPDTTSDQVPVVAASVVEGEVRSIHLPSTTTTTTVSADDNENDAPVMDDPTIYAKHGNITVGDESKVHNAVFIAAAAGGLVAIMALVVGLRRSRTWGTAQEEDVIPVDDKSTDGSSDGQSSAGQHTAELSLSMASSV